MQKHNQKQICRDDEIDKKMLTFRLKKEQRQKAKGAEVKFRQTSQRYDGYRQIIARAQIYDSEKKCAVTIAAKLIGVVFEDDPEWLYETDKSRSPITERRLAARPRKAEKQPAAASRTCETKEQRAAATQLGSFVKKKVEYTADAIIVKKVPIEILLTVAALSGMRGLTDATSVASYWNTNLSTLREMFPEYGLEEISHDTVRRIYMSLTEKCVRDITSGLYDWLPKRYSQDRRHFAIDGQSCRAARRDEDYRQMMMLNAVDVTAGKLCASHMMIDTKNHEPTHTPELITDFDLHGATVTLDALHTTPAIAEALMGAGAYYLLALKGNQPKLNDAVRKDFAAVAERNGLVEEWTKRTFEHNRWEERGYLVGPAAFIPDEIASRWPGLKDGCIVRTTTKSFRQRRDGTWHNTEETRYFITNHLWEEEQNKPGELSAWLQECVRGHWGVESFHWIMDAVWKQDKMQCKYIEYLRTRETLAKIGHNLVQTLRRIEQEEMSLSKPRSGTQIVNEAAATVESALSWLCKIFDYKARTEASSGGS